MKTNIFKYAWDNLIVLDACRYDVFEEVNELEGELTKIESVGKDTTSWVKGTFKRSFYKNIVYVSANPHVRRGAIERYHTGLGFGRIIPVWKTGFDEELKNVLPKMVNEMAVKIKRDDKMVIHYMNPHAPFLGGVDEVMGGNYRILEERLIAGKLTEVCIKEAYKATLKYVLNQVKELLPFLSGTTVITSDHGEMHGEEGRWGHRPEYPDHPKLREVPLFICEDEEEKAERLLKDLGYM